MRLLPIVMSLFCCVPFTAAFQAVVSPPGRGVWSERAGTRWEESFISGNGRMGVMDQGRAGDETLVVTHAKLFLPINDVPVIPELGDDLPEVRRIIREEGYRAATEYMVQQARPQGYQGLIFTNPFHVGFELRLDAGEASEGPGYARSENFENGEIIAQWQTEGTVWQRRVFISRADNVLVASLTARDAETGERKPVDATVGIPPVPDTVVWAYNANRQTSETLPGSAANQLIDEEVKAKNGGLLLSAAYTFQEGSPLRGYDAAVRVLAPGGEVKGTDHELEVHGADRVLILARLQPAPSGTEDRSRELLRDLEALEADYDALLARHAKVHEALMDRVKVDFGGKAAQRQLPSEVLFAQVKAENTIPPALLEKIYDGSRYTIISSSGVRPPNLQGIWTGTWEPAWSGDYTTDTNLQLAISHLLSCNTPELLDGYFDLIDASLDDWRLNARHLYGVRGLHAPSRQSDNARMFHWNVDWPLHFWTPGAAWLLHWHYQYYLYTGDKAFLRERALPLMEEAALFYEDFLFLDDSGHYRFSPSYSAENGPGDNSTQDISIVRELLTNLIDGYTVLGVEHPKLPVWRKMLDQLPPYVIADNGELQEWAVEGHPNHNNHRHMMHLYGLFQDHEFDPERTPRLWAAAEQAYEGRFNAWFRNPENVGSRKNSETSSHGRMHLALCAARLGRGDDIWEILTRMAAYGAIYDSMASAHYEHGGIFNMDANGGIPEILNRVLVDSLPGELTLLQGLPEAMEQGEVKGLAARGQILVERIAWTPDAVELVLRSAIDQHVDVHLGDETHPVALEAGKPQTLQLER
ncbi:MAG: alpha-L-fucosidase [Puniceicoccaceae bacterium 5H]|nr:MAG: alpha-L-fucosidase [Puniceicoccaceae bacterium 5H]